MFPESPLHVLVVEPGHPQAWTAGVRAAFERCLAWDEPLLVTISRWRGPMARRARSIPGSMIHDKTNKGPGIT